MAPPQDVDAYIADFPAEVRGIAGWKKHVGLYPVSPLDGDLEERIAPYRTKKDSVTFTYTEPIPYGLITEVTAALRDYQR